MDRLDHTFDHRWHVALNAFNYPEGKKWNSAHWMYRAKDAADEVPRMAMLFARERLGQLPAVHHQCSHDVEGTPVKDNHLTCCMGTVCRECPFLLALDKMDTTPENIDIAKAWTCATHILTSIGDEKHFDVSEGFIKTTDDMMYWANLYSSMADMVNDDNDPDDETET